MGCRLSVLRDLAREISSARDKLGREIQRSEPTQIRKSFADSHASCKHSQIFHLRVTIKNYRIANPSINKTRN